MKQLLSLIVCVAISTFSLQAQEAQLSGLVRSAADQQALAQVTLMIQETRQVVESDQKGAFTFQELEAGTYTLTVFREGFATQTLAIELERGLNQQIIELQRIDIQLSTVEVTGKREQTFGLRHLHHVEGTAIYAGKKNEVIELNDITANLATNNPRQIYKGIAGLNIWENDGAGIQLSIGSRGLDPNRTSSFNTRQNGYDISADALGYPESYYTPPSQALERIEIIRGAASLQYGTQFGGLLNFVFKKGKKDKVLHLLSENTVGSFGLVNSFNSIGGENGKWNYYGFYQFKRGDGWRANSGFEQQTAYGRVAFRPNNKVELRAEFTHMNYLAQQAGGLTDAQFAENPRQSNRNRNWFSVNWNLASLVADFRLSERTRLDIRNFLLLADRKAIGALGRVDRPDPMQNRDLIIGQYRNIGNEIRLLHRYEIGNQTNSLLIGTRAYRGFTTNSQGFGSSGADADFRFANDGEPEWLDYSFPSQNYALFIENLFNLGQGWSLTPGIRLEHIRTTADGYYRLNTFNNKGEVENFLRFESQLDNPRTFLLMGLGVSRTFSEKTEVYANFSQNYRSINFSDLTVVNQNLVVDSLLQDERGYNADLGIRGRLFDLFRFDLSVFYLRYQNRIGLAKIEGEHPFLPGLPYPISFRTNIGDAGIYGLEAYLDAWIWKFGTENVEDQHQDGLSAFLNLSLMNGTYLSGESFFEGKKVELIPPVLIKTGLNAHWKRLEASYQVQYVQEHYSDATNAVFFADATVGLIPSYVVMDISFSCDMGLVRLQTGINNLADAAYFTRRANGYPGPGILPADGRSFYLTAKVEF
jgi:Fe(3+) dicitrate transport protein